MLRLIDESHMNLTQWEQMKTWKRGSKVDMQIERTHTSLYSIDPNRSPFLSITTKIYATKKRPDSILIKSPGEEIRQLYNIPSNEFSVAEDFSPSLK